MTACNVVDCAYNTNGVICSRDVTMILNGYCNWLFDRNGQVNPNFKNMKEVNNNEQKEI